MSTIAPKLPIAKIREIIRSGFFLRDMMTGGTREEFARQNVGPELLARAAQIAGLEIPERFQVDRMEANAEIARLQEVAARWELRRREYLDKITDTRTAFNSFQELLDAPGGYFPSLRKTVAEESFLADCYDAAQTERGDSRRAFLS